MAYEGCQPLTYDYEDIRDPDRTLPRAVLPAVVVVTGVYVAVALAAASLVGASTLVDQRETALAAAGEEIAGLAGKIVVSIAAAFSAASAINATLFATARLSRRIAAEGELPRAFVHENTRGVPDRSVVVLGAAGMALALLGSLGGLVEAASITFLATFTGVNVMAARRLPDRRLLPILGAVGAPPCSTLNPARLGRIRAITPGGHGR